MGFMGFGMQKWIYTMRPRKPFSIQRKSSFTSVPTYSRNFKLQYSKNNENYNFGILLFFVVVIVTSFAIPNWLTQARLHNEEVIALEQHKEDQAFEFLKRSGEKRLRTQNYKGAFSEFKLAYAIKPNDKEMNQLLLEVVSLLCEQNEVYCKEFEILKF